MDRWRTPLILLGIGLLAFGLAAGKRLRKQSSDPHFVYLADAWLNGRLSIEDPPPAKGDDWAKVDTVLLEDGREVRGRTLRTRPVFRTLDGEEIPKTEIETTAYTTHYVSFPPFPAVIMLPQVMIHGRIANDVWPTAILGAMCLPLMFLVLRRLREAGLSPRDDRDAIWLSVAFAFGTVFFFSTVQGRVWFTAHIVGCTLGLAYVLCSVEAKHPILAGLCIGCATLSRVPMAFMFPLFVFEAWRMAGGDKRRFWITCAKLAAPVVAIAIVAMIHNYVRFHDPLEFGHGYLDVRQQANMETYGKFNLRYLSRNLTVAFTLLPDFSARSPHVFINGHGLALWFTTPLLWFLLWPRETPTWHRPLWITTALIAIPSLLYMNSGWIQFGYRFSLDYTPFLILLIAIGARPLRRVGYALIVMGVLINLFGAITFPSKTYYDYSSYDNVMKHAPLKKRLSK
jgi:hypothetical protein